jgi:signal transduction histidine kinase/CheY-like chemotaxis protein
VKFRWLTFSFIPAAILSLPMGSSVDGREGDASVMGSWLESVDRFCDHGTAQFSLEVKWRARLIVVLSVAVVVMLVPVAVMLFPGKPFVAAMVIGIQLTAGFCPWFLRRTHSVQGVGYAIMAVFFFATCVLAHQDFGVLAAVGNSTLPLIATFVIGTWTSAVIFAAFAVLAAMAPSILASLYGWRRDITESSSVSVFVLLPLAVAVFGVLTIVLRRCMLREIEAGMVRRERFLANMSHELRTPVHSSIGLTEMLAETNLNEVQLELLRSLRQTQQSLLDVVNDILTLSSLEEGKASLSLQPCAVDLYKLLQDVVDSVGFAAFAKGIRLDVVPPLVCAPTIVQVDPIRLKQVLVNLVGNGIKFTSKGKVVLSCSVKGSGHVECALTFSVADTGIGMDKELLAAVANPRRFLQTSEGISRGGTGLGLFIAHGILACMGSKLEVESVEGKGTTMRFTLAAPSDNVDRARRLKYTFVEAAGFSSDDGYAHLQEVCGSVWDIGCSNEVESLRLPEGRKGDTLVLVKCSRESSFLDILSGHGLHYVRCCDNPLSCDFHSAPSCVGHILLPLSVLRLFEVLEGSKADCASSFIEPKANFQSVSLRQRRPVTSDKMTTRAKPLVSNAHILLADDNAVVRTIVCHQLSALGFQTENIHMAADGEEALGFLGSAKDRLDAALLDCKMPKRTGFEVCTEVRRLEALTKTYLPIILHSATLQPGFKECGADGFVLKPFSKTACKEVLSQFFDFDS